MNLIRGGLKPLLKAPRFKYTFNVERKVWIKNLYPYADVFLEVVRDIGWNQYKYDGIGEYKVYGKNSYVEIACKSGTTAAPNPVCYFAGGCVYELLNKRYTNVNLHKYCDVTGDVDVALYPPGLTDYPDGSLLFLKAGEEITSFYRHFTNWTFKHVVKNLNKYAAQFDKMFPNMVNFDIDEYHDIPDQYKLDKFGYQTEQVDKCRVVAFLNSDATMFKIQVVIKIQDGSVSVIDHALEIIIPVTTDENAPEFIPSVDGYKKSANDYNTIKFPHTTYNVQKWSGLIFDNVNAYIERKPAFSSSNYKDVIHKPINHIARLFYLYELFYRNRELMTSNPKNVPPVLFLFGTREKEFKDKTNDFLYYKIVNNRFVKTTVPVKKFLHAYFELILMDPYSYNMFSRTHPKFFDTSLDSKRMHHDFINELFNISARIKTSPTMKHRNITRSKSQTRPASMPNISTHTNATSVKLTSNNKTKTKRATQSKSKTKSKSPSNLKSTV